MPEPKSEHQYVKPSPNNGVSSPESPGAIDGGSRAVGALKTTGKVAGRLTAIDVLWKDGRRMRPRNPELWRDVFSKKGWQAALAKASKSEAKPITPGTLIIPLVHAGIGAIIAVYSLAMIFAHPVPEAIPTLNKIVIMMMLLVSTIYSTIYVVVFALQVARYRRSCARKTQNGGGSK